MSDSMRDLYDSPNFHGRTCIRSHFTFFSPEEIAIPRGDIVDVWNNFWFATTEDGRVAVYVMDHYEYLQGNLNPNIADGIRTTPELTGPIIQIPLAFTKHRCD